MTITDITETRPRLNPARANEPATPKQKSFIGVLVRKHQVEEQWVRQIILDLQAGTSKGRASRWIEWLQKQPLKAPGAAPVGWVNTTHTDSNEHEAKLANQEAPAEARTPITLQPGVYTQEIAGVDVVYRVSKRRGSHRLRVQRLAIRENQKPFPQYAHYSEIGELAYNGRRLSAEEAGKHGLYTGWCIVCGRELTDPESVAAGIGPVCAKNHS